MTLSTSPSNVTDAFIKKKSGGFFLLFVRRLHTVPSVISKPVIALHSQMSSSTAGLTLDRVQQTMDGVERNLRNAQDAVGTFLPPTLVEHSDTCQIDFLLISFSAFFVHSAFLARNYELVSLSESGPDQGANSLSLLYS